jgi:DNA-directed RNA polymerase specialized sigma24 family protein
MSAHEREPSLLEDGYELFRRAIVERDEAAWGEIYERYHIMLIGWARQSNTTLQLPEDYGDIADQALTRAWSALTPESFARFPNLASLLGYLRSCVSALMIDIARSRASRERTVQRLFVEETATPEEIVMGRIAREELWRVLKSIPMSAAERAVLLCYYVYAMPPRDIQAHHPELFPTVPEVYAAQRSLKACLQRSVELRRLLGE